MSDSEDNSPDLSSINWNNGKKIGNTEFKTTPKIDDSDLLNSIESTKNVSELKRQFLKKDKIQTLDAPLNRLDQSRIDHRIAHTETKYNLNQWQDIVNEHRISERLVIKPRKGVEPDAKHQTPKTDLEKQMAEILDGNKNKLIGKITQAEKEILKAMDIETARENFEKLRKMRRLMSYQESKFRREGRIKSKAYHRIKKRQERRKVIKEFEELVTKDPNAAKAKLDQLETDRIYERAELRHRGQNKWSKELRQYASKNPEIKKTLSDHLKFHRELKQKHGDGAFSSSEDEEEQPARLGVEDIMKLAADQALNEKAETEIETVDRNPWLTNELSKLRNRKAEMTNQMILKESVPEQPEFEVDPEFSTSLVSIVKKQTQTEIKAKLEALMEGKRIINSNAFDSINANNFTDEVKEPEEMETRDINSKTNPKSESVNRKSVKKGKRKMKMLETKLKAGENLQIDEIFGVVEEEIRKLDDDNDIPQLKKKKREQKIKPKNVAKQVETPKPVDTIDLKTFLEVNSIVTNEFPENVNDCLEDGDEEVDRNNLLAEAFADDDVVDFEEDKKHIEEEEDPLEEEHDISKMGWGSWVGPGIETKKEEPKKKKPLERKDARKTHVVIRENANNPIVDLQPQSVPLPYADATSYEVVMQQPIGRDWNPNAVTAKMTEPRIVAPAGRIIQPMRKEQLSWSQDRARTVRKLKNAS